MKIEIKNHENQKVLFINNEMFDWQIEEEELDDAVKFANNDEKVKKAIKADIQNFFLSCLSEVVGQNITLKELNDAIEKGCLEK
jgi:alpha-L-arabinofuranosidase